MRTVLVVTLLLGATAAGADLVVPSERQADLVVPSERQADLVPSERQEVPQEAKEDEAEPRAELVAASTATPCPKPGDVAAAAAADDDGSLSSQVKGALASGNFFFALILVMIGGLLTALSPCVYPLIPITLSILGARQAASKVQGFLLAGTYVSGMVILYSALGVGFAAAGVLAGSMLQNPLVTIGFALLCVAMAASMFGAFEIRLPSGLQTRLSQAGGAGFKGAFVMGLVAGIIAAPCTGPVLSFILTLIARDGDIAKGAILMVAYALGMGLPFLILGTFSQAIARMPKSGRWMEVVKGIFGLLMIGAGLYYLRLGFPSLVQATEPLGVVGWLGPVLLIVGVAVGALHLSFKMSTGTEKVRKALGVVIAVTGVSSLLAWLDKAPESSGEPIEWVVIKNTPDATTKFDAALAQAKSECKPVMIDFFAEWCIACKELDKYTYPDERVRAEAARFVSVKIDATKDDPQLDALQKRFGVVGLPTIVFIDGSGTVLKDPQVTGFVEAPAYLSIMKRVR